MSALWPRNIDVPAVLRSSELPAKRIEAAGSGVDASTSGSGELLDGGHVEVLCDRVLKVRTCLAHCQASARRSF